MNPERDDKFWKPFSYLAWSNPEAGDTVMIRASLVRPELHVLRAVCERFTIERVKAEWEFLLGDPLVTYSEGHRAVVAELIEQVQSEMAHAA